MLGHVGHVGHLDIQGKMAKEAKEANGYVELATDEQERLIARMEAS
jgi:hypothetical protein